MNDFLQIYRISEPANAYSMYPVYQWPNAALRDHYDAELVAKILYDVDIKAGTRGWQLRKGVWQSVAFNDNCPQLTLVTDACIASGIHVTVVDDQPIIARGTWGEMRDACILYLPYL